MIYIVTGLAFVAGFLLIFGMNLVMLSVTGDRQQQIRARLEAELQLTQKERARGSMANKELFELMAEGYGDLAAQPTLIEKVRAMIEQAGLSTKAENVFIWTLVFGLVPTLLIGWKWNWLIGGLVGAMLGSLPIIIVVIRRNNRQKKLLSQLPDAFELMSRVLRAGQTVSQAMQSVSMEFERPISEEFAYCWEQQNLGLSPEAAMRDLARRTGMLELRIFVVALMVHRSTGGNFAELLDKLARVIRDRDRIRGQIAALTAEGQFQAVILLTLPPALMGILFLINKSYVLSLFEYPALLIGMVLFEIIGAAWMQKIIRFDF